MSNLTEIKESVKSTNKIWQPKQDKQWKLIQDYKKYDFNYQSVLRINNNYQDNFTNVYNNKMSPNYVDGIMDRLVNRKSITQAIAFIECDDNLNNHLHFAWHCPIELTRKQLANTMRTNIKYIRNIEPINGVEAAIRYFTKRTEATNSYQNMYA
mgnify:FL=1|tara:strand:- start:188 stop:649 length:462 start_codon:yes stop_codon:yes gene_type:complete